MYEDRLRANDWVVRPVDIDVARRLVEAYHYAAGASNSATYLHGLFHRDAFWESECMGAAWWIPPTKSAAHATYPANWQQVLSLSRLVVHPSLPKNACSFLLGASMRRISRADWPALVTYADTWREHTGTIYKATNWTYAGLTRATEVYILNGRMVAPKSHDHTRTHAEMLALGCEFIGRFAKHKYVHIAQVKAAQQRKPTLERAA